MEKVIPGERDIHGELLNGIPNIESIQDSQKTIASLFDQDVQFMMTQKGYSREKAEGIAARQIAAAEMMLGLIQS